MVAKSFFLQREISQEIKKDQTPKYLLWFNVPNIFPSILTLYKWNKTQLPT